MSELAINGAIEHIEKSSYALLVTVGDDGKPAVREIGPFINSGLDVCFVTRNDSRKVKEFTNRPFITLYFPTMSLSPREFKAAAVSGAVARISSEAEMNDVLDRLGQKSPGYKNYITKEGLSVWGVYKMTAENLQFTDYSKSTRTVKLWAPLNIQFCRETERKVAAPGARTSRIRCDSASERNEAQ